MVDPGRCWAGEVQPGPACPALLTLSHSTPLWAEATYFLLGVMGAYFRIFRMNLSFWSVDKLQRQDAISPYPRPISLDVIMLLLSAPRNEKLTVPYEELASGLPRGSPWAPPQAPWHRFHTSILSAAGVCPGAPFVSVVLSPQSPLVRDDFSVSVCFS